jgi:hypothetical protein
MRTIGIWYVETRDVISILQWSFRAKNNVALVATVEKLWFPYVWDSNDQGCEER